MVTTFNFIPSNSNRAYQKSENSTFSQQVTLIKTEIEHSPINVFELRKQLNALTPYLEKASLEDMKEALKMLNQVKDNIQISGNDWEKNFKDLERKFIQADLLSWGNIPEARGKISDASLRILKVFDDNLIELTMNNLELNSLPESFGQLSQLEWLNLTKNQLHSLPESFGQLSQLQRLNLTDNCFTSLPESFGRLSQLQMLNLTNNRLQFLPESFGKLSQLQTLDLVYNRLIFLSESFGKLSQIQALYLSNNQLRSLPESFAQLSQLERLYLSNNQLEFLTESFGKLSQIQTLDLSKNQLKSLPMSFGQLSQIQTLYLSDNQLRSLPEPFGQLSQLRTLSLNDNQLESLPMSLAYCRKSLAYLDLKANQNLKKLPPSFEFLYRITEINIGETSINPEELATMRVKWAAVNRIDAIQLLHIR